VELAVGVAARLGKWPSVAPLQKAVGLYDGIWRFEMGSGNEGINRDYA
jgi:hypothetical protein